MSTGTVLGLRKMLAANKNRLTSPCIVAMFSRLVVMHKAAAGPSTMATPQRGPVVYRGPATATVYTPARDPVTVARRTRRSGTLLPLRQGQTVPSAASAAPPASFPSAIMADGRQLEELLQELSDLAVTRSKDLNPRGLVIIAHALAVLNYPHQRLLGNLARAAEPCLAQLSPFDLAQLLLSLGRLHHVPSPSWSQAAALALVQAIEHLPPAATAAGLYGATLLGLPCRPWLPHIMAHLFPKLAHCDGKSLGQIGAALHGLAVVPDVPWLAEYQACAKRLRGKMTPASQLQVLLCASLAAPAADPGWVHSHYSTLEPHLGTLTARQLSQLLRALARVGKRPVDLRSFFVASAPRLQRFSTPELVESLDSLAALGVAAPAAWMHEVLTVSMYRLGYMAPEQSTALLLALARLGVAPDATWLEQAASLQLWRLYAFSPGQLAGTLTAMARMGYRPPLAWLDEFDRRSSSYLTELSPDALAGVGWALARIGHQPSASWLYGFVQAAYARLDAFSGSQLVGVFEALPRMAPANGWLDGLVQICAEEATRAAAVMAQGAAAAGASGTAASGLSAGLFSSAGNGSPFSMAGSPSSGPAGGMVPGAPELRAMDPCTLRALTGRERDGVVNGQLTEASAGVGFGDVVRQFGDGDADERRRGVNSWHHDKHGPVPVPG